MVRSVLTALLAVFSPLAADAELEEGSEVRTVASEPFEPSGPGREGSDHLARNAFERALRLPDADPPLVCGACQRVHRSDGAWHTPVGDLERLRREASFGLCPRCARERFPDLLGDA